MKFLSLPLLALLQTALHYEFDLLASPGPTTLDADSFKYLAALGTAVVIASMCTLNHATSLPSTLAPLSPFRAQENASPTSLFMPADLQPDCVSITLSSPPRQARICVKKDLVLSFEDPIPVAAPTHTHNPDSLPMLPTTGEDRGSIGTFLSVAFIFGCVLAFFRLNQKRSVLTSLVMNDVELDSVLVLPRPSTTPLNPSAPVYIPRSQPSAPLLIPSRKSSPSGLDGSAPSFIPASRRVPSVIPQAPYGPSQSFGFSSSVAPLLHAGSARRSSAVILPLKGSTTIATLSAQSISRTAETHSGLRL